MHEIYNNERLTEIFDYGMNGEGVTKLNGKITLVKNVLLNEVVDIEIEKEFKNYSNAKVKKIIKTSAKRVNPPCPYFEICGGCDLQHMTYDEQLKFKSLLVRKTIKKIADIDFDVAPTVESNNQYSYRNKVSFAFIDGKIGFYKKNSKSVIDIEQCNILSPNLNIILKLAREFFDGKEYFNDIKNIVVREINNQILVGVVARKNLKICDFYTFLHKNFKNIGLFLVKNTRNDAVVLTNNISHIGGIKEIKIENFGLTYFVDLLGFHQTNIDIQNKIYNKVLELINSNSNIINGFSGAGLLSAVMAKKAKSVVGIEIVKSSHLSAEKLKADNKIKNLTNILGDFNLEIKKLKDNEILVLDPPKKGIDEKVLKNIVASNPLKEIIYISCNPIALAKDLRYLKNYYIINLIEPFDMFPNTCSVETLVRLKLKEN